MKTHPLFTCLAAIGLAFAAAPRASAASPEIAKPATAIAGGAEKPSIDAADDELLDGKVISLEPEEVSVIDELRTHSLGTSPSKLPRLGPLNEGAATESGERTVQYQQDLAGAVQNGAPAGYWTGSQAYQWQVLPQGLIYRSYLAGEKESRFRSEWNHTDSGRNIWDVSLGGNVGILRYGTTGDVRPQGWQLGIEGAGQPRLDLDEDRDVDAADFRFGIPMTWGDSIYQVKFAFYHLSSHIQDEYLLKHPGFPRLNYSRNVFVWGHSLYPTENFRVYGELGYGFNVDVSKPWELQFGVDYSPSYATGVRGAPFAAVNAHLRQEVNYGGNLNAQAGWAWRRSPASGLYRIGVEYFNGKDDQFSFFNDSLQKIGFGMWYDY